MKVLFLILSLFSGTALGSTLLPDLQCVNTVDEKEITYSILDIDFAKEVTISDGKKSCTLSIVEANHSQRSVAPNLSFIFRKAQSCQLGKIRVQDEGFIKILLDKNGSEAWVLALIGKDSLNCQLKHFNQKKLVNRIQNSF